MKPWSLWIKLWLIWAIGPGSIFMLSQIEGLTYQQIADSVAGVPDHCEETHDPRPYRMFTDHGAASDGRRPRSQGLRSRRQLGMCSFSRSRQRLLNTMPGNIWLDERPGTSGGVEPDGTTATPAWAPCPRILPVARLISHAATSASAQVDAGARAAPASWAGMFNNTLPWATSGPTITPRVGQRRNIELADGSSDSSQYRHCH